MKYVRNTHDEPWRSASSDRHSLTVSQSPVSVHPSNQLEAANSRIPCQMYLSLQPHRRFSSPWAVCDSPQISRFSSHRFLRNFHHSRIFCIFCRIRHTSPVDLQKNKYQTGQISAASTEAQRILLLLYRSYARRHDDEGRPCTREICQPDKTREVHRLGTSSVSYISCSSGGYCSRQARSGQTAPNGVQPDNVFSPGIVRRYARDKRETWETHQAIMLVND